MMRHLTHDIVKTAFFSAINLPVLNKILDIEGGRVCSYCYDAELTITTIALHYKPRQTLNKLINVRKHTLAPCPISFF